MTVLVEKETLTALDLVMEEMRRTMPGVRIDRSTAVRYLLSKALTPYRRTSEAPVTLEADQAPTGKDRGADRLPMDADQFAQQAAPSQDRKRTTVRKRPAAAKGDAHGAAGVR